MSDFVPAHTFVTATDASPHHWTLVLHGIFGRGANWRTFARRYVERRPEVGLVLVDLRMHGESQAAPAPHTVTAAAGDLVALADALAADGKVVRGVIGHSFGGKVALLYAGQAGVELDEVWVLDSDPAARPEAMRGADTVRVLETLEAAPDLYDARDEFIDFVTGRGYPKPLAQWLAMNVVADGERYRLAMDRGAVRALLTSYYETDAFEVVGRLGSTVRVVLGGASAAVSRESRERLAESDARVDVIEGAGHWLHVEALDAVVELVAG